MSERSARHFSSSNAAAGGDKMGEGKMNFEVVIVGSGLAGLSVALNLAETRRVAVIAKVSMTEGASDWAQGGIAAVLDSADSIENHVSDTLIAGGGLCDSPKTMLPSSAFTSRAKAATATGGSFTQRTRPATRWSPRSASACAAIRTSRCSKTTMQST
jgi:aspartate oxidase